jgi:hypothetical protein
LAKSGFGELISIGKYTQPLFNEFLWGSQKFDKPSLYQNITKFVHKPNASLLNSQVGLM